MYHKIESAFVLLQNYIDGRIWVSPHSNPAPQLSGKWLQDYDIGYEKDQVP